LVSILWWSGTESNCRRLPSAELDSINPNLDQSRSSTWNGTKSAFDDVIRDMTGFRITVGPRLSEFEGVLNKAIPPATEPFAKARRNVTTEGQRPKLAGALRADTSGAPDFWEDLAEGKRLALAKDVGDASTEAENFWLRSFLYAGLARHRSHLCVPSEELCRCARAANSSRTRAQSSIGNDHAFVTVAGSA
jgi:hypothetical protein